MFRRSGVLVPLEGDEKRFRRGRKPERQKAANVEAERGRLRKEIARAEDARERSVQSNAPPEVVEAEREKLPVPP